MPSSKNFKANEKVQCPCGGSYSLSNRATHMKTKKCLKFHETSETKPITQICTESEPLRLLKIKLHNALGADIFKNVFLNMSMTDEEWDKQQEMEEKVMPLLENDKEDDLYEMERARLELERWEHVLKCSNDKHQDDLIDIKGDHDFTNLDKETEKYKTADDKIEYLTQKIDELEKKDTTLIGVIHKYERYRCTIKAVERHNRYIKDEYDRVVRQANPSTFVYPYERS